MPEANEHAAATHNRQKLYRVDLSRGLAALAIVFYHASSIVQSPKYCGTVPFGEWFVLGGAGVDFFFVLSGFIILYMHRKDLHATGRVESFLRKRAIRIFPLYWLITAVVLAAYAGMPGYQPANELAPARLTTTLLLLPHPAAPPLGVAWSLRYEIVFYVLFALILVNFRGGLILYCVWQIAIVISLCTGGHDQFLARQLLDARNLDFTMGMGAAWMLRKYDKKSGRWLAGIGTVLLLAVCAASFRGAIPIRWEIHSVLVGATSMLVLLGLASLDIGSPWMPKPLVKMLGAASYAVYLTHYALLSALAKLFVSLRLNNMLTPELLFLCLSALALIGGMLIHVAVEAPVQRYVRNRFAKDASA